MFERFTDRARRVVVLAQEEARLLNHNYIGTEHILLGLVRERKGVAAQVLQELGADLSRVRWTVVQLLSGYAGESEAASGAGGLVEMRGVPHCPGCHATLADTAGCRTLTVPGADDEKAREVVVVFCRACGRAIGTLGGS